MNSIAIDSTAPALDESEWRALCEAQASLAAKRCGLSHGLYVDSFSAKIDAKVNQLPETQRASALQIAREWDYATPAERQEEQDWNAENGYCPHGIEWDCCPAGCGDLKVNFEAYAHVWGAMDFARF